jgi:hypothetical protein
MTKRPSGILRNQGASGCISERSNMQGTASAPYQKTEGFKKKVGFALWIGGKVSGRFFFNSL